MKTTTIRPASSRFARRPRGRAAWLAALAVTTGLLGACGGGEEDSGPANPLAGTWYSANIMTSWSFEGGSSTASGSGEIRTLSYDGGSCQITNIDYTVDNSANTVTYTITRARMTGNSDYNYDSGVISDGPYRESYTLSGSSLTIGNGSYTTGGQAC